MLPIIHFLGRDIGTYSIMAMIGLLVCGFVISALARRKGICVADVILALLCASAGLLIGSHILYGIVNYKQVIGAFSEIGSISFISFVMKLGTAFGGAVFYGGFLGGILGIYVFLKLEKKIDKKDLFDLYAVSVPLFHTFGRIGCFLAGCCYGVECSMGFTAHGNHMSPGVNDVCRFPVQLVEAGLNLLLFIAMAVLIKKIKNNGKMLFIYMTIYPVYRFILEFFRGDEIRGLWLGLSTSQWISVILFVVGVCGILAGKVRVTKFHNTSEIRGASNI